MRNGFTLVELLAVIIILSAIALITTVATGSIIKNSKENLSEVQISKIEEAAKTYYLKEGMSGLEYESNSYDTCVSVNRLIANGYVEKDQILDPKTNKQMTGSVLISYSSNKYTYEYQKSDCEYLCKAVTDSNDTAGNIPSGNYQPGDEYICEVKDGTEYHFFILNTEEDKVNLILDRNIYYNSDTDNGLTDVNNLGKVAWNSSGNNMDGPVTAMDYLYNATKTWTNIPNINIDYIDEGATGCYGYGGIKTSGNKTVITKSNGTIAATYTDLKARMPYKSEINAFDSTTRSNYYLYNYLLNDPDVYGINWYSNNIPGIVGYWTFASYFDTSDPAWAVWFRGYIDFCATALTFGVRPVITIPKSYIE